MQRRTQLHYSSSGQRHPPPSAHTHAAFSPALPRPANVHPRTATPPPPPLPPWVQEGGTAPILFWEGASTTPTLSLLSLSLPEPLPACPPSVQAGVHGADSIFGKSFDDDPGGLALRHDTPGLLSAANSGE
jgi:hypothetical protein